MPSHYGKMKKKKTLTKKQKTLPASLKRKIKKARGMKQWLKEKVYTLIFMLREKE